MCSTTFLILGYLLQANAISPISAVTILDLIKFAEDEVLHSYSTVHYNLNGLIQAGFVQKGITMGRKHTYFVTKLGADWFNSL